MKLGIILVEPKYGLNIGYVARTMKNFGVNRLILTGIDKIPPSAYRFSSHARELLEKAEVMSYEDAIKGFEVVVGTTAKRAFRSSNVVRSTLLPEEVVPFLKNRSSVGLVLGRDTTGLRNDELEKCDFVVSIPTGTEYATLNISHALAILLYVLRRVEMTEPLRKAPLRSEREKMMEYIDKILESIEFPEHRRLRVVKTFNKMVLQSDLRREDLVTILGFMRRVWLKVSRLDR
jgi:TrmH family RNA methyltransferase